MILIFNNHSDISLDYWHIQKRRNFEANLACQQAFYLTVTQIHMGLGVGVSTMPVHGVCDCVNCHVCFKIKTFIPFECFTFSFTFTEFQSVIGPVRNFIMDGCEVLKYYPQLFVGVQVSGP